MTLPVFFLCADDNTFFLVNIERKGYLLYNYRGFLRETRIVINQLKFDIDK